MIVKATVVAYFLVFLILALRRPGYALACLLISYLAFEQWVQAHDGFFGANPAVINFASAAVVGAGAVASFAKGARPLSIQPPWSMVAFYGLLFASYMWAFDRDSHSMILNQSAPYLITFLVFLPLCFNSMEDLRDAFKGLVIGGSIVALLVLVGTETIGGRGIELAEGAVNRYGREEKAGNPLAIASMGGYMIISTILLHFRGASKYAMGILKWCIVAIGFAVVFRSGSRGQLYSLVLVVPVFALAASPKVNVKHLMFALVGLAATGLIGWWATSFIPEAALTRWGQNSAVNDYGHRIEMSRMLLVEWTRSGPLQWLFGLGLGASWSVLGIYPHVVPVQVLGEAGLIGLFFYGSFHVLAVVAWVRLYYATKGNPEVRSIVAIVGALFAYQFILCFKQGGISGGHHVWLFPFLLNRFGSILTKQNALTKQKAMPSVTFPSTAFQS